jgi:lysophospholipase L1-like esterase
MKSKHYISALLSVVLAVPLLSGIDGHAQVRAAEPVRSEFYLALGDGMTAGYQGDASFAWSDGWTFQLRDILAKTGSIELVDLGHTGECTDTFISGGTAKDCPKQTGSPSQLAEATAFLEDHVGIMRLVTVQVGADNLFGALPSFMTSTAAQQQATLATLLPRMAHDWGVIFSTLRKACPDCQIVALNQYNPYPKGAITVDLAPLFQHYTELLSQAATPAKVTVADINTPFVGHELKYTWMASGHPDPTTKGFTTIAQAVAKVAALGRPARSAM